MALLTAVSLSRKLPVIIAALCIAASVSIAVVGYLDFNRNINQEVRENFRILTESRGAALSSWFDHVEKNVASLGSDPTIIAAATAFTSSYDLMIDSAGLQAAYIINNPNPVGQKDLLVQAPDSIPYHFQHGQFHSHFRQIQAAEEYYDILLFNKHGDMIYSVEKEPDFATNFVTGPYASSGLGAAFQNTANGAVGDVTFSDFAGYAPSNGAAAGFVATSLIDQSGQFIGVIAVQVPNTKIGSIVNDPLGLGETGEVYVVGPDMTTRSELRLADDIPLLSDVSEIALIASLFGGGEQFSTNLIGVRGRPVLAKGTLIDVFDQQWAIISERDQTEVNAPIALVRNKMIIVTLLVAGIGTVLGWMIARSVVMPLGRLGGAMQHVSEKHYDVDLGEQDRGDEIGGLFAALDAFRDKLRASDHAEEVRQAQQEKQVQVVGRLSVALTKLADGDLKHKISTPFDGDYDQLRQDFNRTVVNLNQTIGSVVLRAGAIRDRSDGMSKSADDLSRRTENQAATLEETAAALDEMTASVKSAADGSRQVKDVVGNARQDADAANPVVQSAVGAMTEIESSSQEISQIIGVIDDIAFQTNLLALNAGVEAARAGEAGRGFAVVASEVRALAQRSSDAAKQIKSLIGESSDQVQRGVSLVGQAGEVLTKIAGHINHISDLVAEIASGAEEQSIGLGEINIGVTQLDKVTQQNAAMVEEATESSHALHSDAAELAHLVTRFELDEASISAPSVVDNITQFVPQPTTTPLQEDGPARAHVAAAVGARAQSADNIWQDF